MCAAGLLPRHRLASPILEAARLFRRQTQHNIDDGIAGFNNVYVPPPLRHPGGNEARTDSHQSDIAARIGELLGQRLGLLVECALRHAVADVLPFFAVLGYRSHIRRDVQHLPTLALLQAGFEVLSNDERPHDHCLQTLEDIIVIVRPGVVRLDTVATAVDQAV